MGRFLFVAPPVRPQVEPAVAVGHELEARGHEVAWAGHPEIAGLLAGGTPFFPVDHRVPDTVQLALAQRRPDELRGPAGLRFHWEDYLLPLSRSMVPGVRSAITTFDADVVITDQQALAGAAVAQSLRVPWVTTLTTAAQVADPVGNLPLVSRWIDGLLRDLCLEVGVTEDEADALDLRLSPYAVVAFSTEALLGDAGLPAHTTFAGPSLAPEPTGAFDVGTGAAGVDGPIVVIRPDPLYKDLSRSFVNLVLEALSALDVQAILVGPADLDAGPLVQRAAAVVDHGTHGNVCAALAAGTPLLLAPIADDQPVMAQQVVDAGAGVRVAMGRLDAAGLRRVIAHALSDQELLAGAARVRDSFLGAGGRAVAADRIEELLGVEPVIRAGVTAARQVPA